MKGMMKYLKEEGPVGEFATGYAESSKFSNPDFSYPDFEKAIENDGVKPEWFYDVRDRGSASEMGAIRQYVDNSFAFEEYSDLALGISIVEMVHLDKLSDLIVTIGGTVKRHWSNKNQKFAKDVKEAVNNDLRDELTAIEDYEKLLEKLKPIKTNTGIICYKLVRKLKADEEHHAKLLREFLSKL